MARITNFLKLWLPEADDVYNVEKDQNENFEKIDAKLKELANSKENFIKDKKSAFNLDKTNLTENDSDKLFTAKGALDLFNRLTTAINTAVENMKNVLRVDIAKKIDKTSISDSLTSKSTTTVLSSAGAKDLEDKKLNIIDAWRYQIKLIGNADTETDLDDILEPGEYANYQNINKFIHTPDDYRNLAFNLTVETINLSSVNYRTQTLKSFIDARIYKRAYVEKVWRPWVRVDGNDKLPLSGGTLTGALKARALEITNSHYTVFSHVPADTGKESWAWFRWKNQKGFWNSFIFNTENPNNLERSFLLLRKEYDNNGTYKDIVFPNFNTREEVAYRSWITWDNVSGKPSSFPPSSHTHDDKLNVSDAWKYISKEIGNRTSATNLNDILEPGDYNSTSSDNKFTSLPADYNNGAFNLTVEAINKNSPNYRTQILKSFVDSRIYKRVYVKDGNRGWSAWERIDSVGLLEKVNAAPVLLFSGSFQMDGGKTLTLPNFSQYRYLLVTVGVENTPESSKSSVLGTMTFMLPVQAPDRATNMSYSGGLINNDWFDIRGVNDTQLYCRAGYGVWVHRVYGVYF